MILWSMILSLAKFLRGWTEKQPAQSWRSNLSKEAVGCISLLEEAPLAWPNRVQGLVLWPKAAQAAKAAQEKQENSVAHGPRCSCCHLLLFFSDPIQEEWVAIFQARNKRFKGEKGVIWSKTCFGAHSSAKQGFSGSGEAAFPLLKYQIWLKPRPTWSIWSLKSELLKSEIWRPIAFAQQDESWKATQTAALPSMRQRKLHWAIIDDLNLVEGSDRPHAQEEKLCLILVVW